MEAPSGYDAVTRLRRRWLFRMVHGRYPLQEKLTLFWHDHFATAQSKVVRAPLLETQLATLRAHAGAPSGFHFTPTVPAAPGDYPALAFTTTEAGASADVTVVTYGGLTDMVEEALVQLILDEELEIDYFILSQLSPLDTRDIAESVRRTGRLVTVEEGPERFGIGSEVATQVMSVLGDRSVRIARVGAVDVPIPNSRVQEREVLPSLDRIIDAIRRLF